VGAEERTVRGLIGKMPLAPLPDAEWGWEETRGPKREAPIRKAKPSREMNEDGGDGLKKDSLTRAGRIRQC